MNDQDILKKIPYNWLELLEDEFLSMRRVTLGKFVSKIANDFKLPADNPDEFYQEAGKKFGLTGQQLQEKIFDNVYDVTRLELFNKHYGSFLAKDEKGEFVYTPVIMARITGTSEEDILEILDENLDQLEKEGKVQFMPESDSKLNN
jgi:hypothetical protein